MNTLCRSMYLTFCLQELELQHSRISSISALRLERFPRLIRLGLRQNAISAIELPEQLAPILQELELYDNLISHIKGLEDFTELRSLDLSYNKIKHIKRVDHLKKVDHLYFVQNKISKIEGLEGLDSLTYLELGANRIRVCHSSRTNSRKIMLTSSSGDRRPRNTDNARTTLAWPKQDY